MKKVKVRTTPINIDGEPPANLRAPAERWQHGDCSEQPQDGDRPQFRVQRLRTAADLLLSRGDIDAEHFTAFTRYRKEYERGLLGASLPLDDLRISSSGNGVAGYLDMRVGAVHSLRLADQALGEQGRTVMLVFAVHGLSYLSAEAALGAEPDGPLGSPGRKVLKELLITTLDRLARHYSGELYRVRAVRRDKPVPVALPAVSRKPLDLEAVSKAIQARITEYQGLGATSDAVAALLRAEFGDVAERVLEIEFTE